MPPPESLTDNVATPSACVALSVIVPPDGVCRSAFATRFSIGLFDPIGIGNHLIRQRVDVDANRHRLRLRFPFVPSSHILEEPLDIEEPPLQHHAAVFVTGEVQQVFHDALEPAGFAIDRLEIPIAALGVERDLGHAQRFDVSAHRGQRRFQFM